MNAAICEAIKRKAVIAFQYNGTLRLVEPQCHGISTAGHEVLRAVQIAAADSRTTGVIGKLFKVSKMSDLKKTGKYFAHPAPNHNPKDKAMRVVHCCLASRRGGGKKSS